MDHEALHIRAGMTEDEVSQSLAATIWDASPAETRQCLEELAAHCGYADVLTYLCQHLREQSKNICLPYGDKRLNI